MPHVRLKGLRKDYGGIPVVAGLDVEIEQGEFFSLLGPSGCGKSTTLRMIAGFVRATSGEIEIGGTEVSHLPAERRGMGFVFQNYAIFPHMSVFDNIAFGLRVRRVPKEEIRRRVAGALAQVDLEGYEARYQREMSGGQQQRVALARVLVTEPRLLLLDEPMSSLDRKLREELKVWIKEFQKSLDITTIYVTHDQGEALAMSDRIAVMREGRIEQVGTPVEIYERPANRFVTEFIGHANVLAGTVAAVGAGHCEVAIAGHRLCVPAGPETGAGQPVCIGVRPEHVRLGRPQEESGGQCLRARLVDTVYQGAYLRHVFDLHGQKIMAEVSNRDGLSDVRRGTELPIFLRSQDLWVVRD